MVHLRYCRCRGFQEELTKTPEIASIPELVLAYNRANRQAAILCNHQRTVPKSFNDSMNRLADKVQRRHTT